ncbi:MAG: response regulator transcription factor [Kiritimatiellae bacterium]|nr:response regulator transcription factor [Kiritimatiellia bacterium]
MPKRKILIVEDDRDIARLVRYNLEKSGFATVEAGTGEAALDLLSRERVDLIVLDLMLPEIDGLDVCRRIKQSERLADLPVLMLTAKGEEVDRIVGFELGADDYVTKPFSPRELVLRVKAILRRQVRQVAGKDVLRAGGIEVAVAGHRVTAGGMPIDLTALEFKLLVTLMARIGRVQTRDRLLEDVWDVYGEVTTRTVDTHVKRLRQKLGAAGARIETVRGVGYRVREGDG